ncbi:hypothetical protein [Blautia hydrogenotrophica]
MTQNGGVRMRGQEIRQAALDLGFGGLSGCGGSGVRLQFSWVL